MSFWPSLEKINDFLFEKNEMEEKTIQKLFQYIQNNYEKLNIEKLKTKIINEKNINEALQWKEKGNIFFQKKEWKESIKCYTKVFFIKNKN